MYVWSRVVVNLGEELEGVMREARGLDRLGFAVPETVASITLQYPQLRSAAEDLAAMLLRYVQVATLRILFHIQFAL
jgi:Dynein heavy chain, N-terminal region 1